MRKKFTAVIMSLCLALAACFACLSFAACTDNGTSGEAGDGTEETLVVDLKRDLGEYSGYEVWYARYYYAGKNNDTEEVEIEIGGVYIGTAPDPSYNYVAVTGDEEYILLEDAYGQGLVTYEDLVAIAAEEADWLASQGQ